jgi:hypothetical protein
MKHPREAASRCEHCKLDYASSEVRTIAESLRLCARCVEWWWQAFFSRAGS